MCVCVCFAFMYIHAPTFVPGAYGGPKKVSDSLELEMQISCHVAAWSVSFLFLLLYLAFMSNGYESSVDVPEEL